MKPLTGVVISNKMTKTTVVEVTARWQHPIYKKVIKRTKKYLVHDEKEVANPGDKVSIVPAKPVSKRKRWSLQEIIEKA